MINYHKYGASNNTNLTYNSGGEKPKTILNGLTSRGQQHCVPSKQLYGRIHSHAFFQLLEADCILCPHFQSQHWTVHFFSHCISLIWNLLPSSFTYKDPCHYTGLPQIIQNNLSILRPLITFAETLLPQVLGISMQMSLGLLFCLLQTAQYINLCTFCNLSEN